MTNIERAAEVLRELAADNRRHKGDYFEGKAEAYTIAAEYLERIQGERR
jgi:hypothetical protein